MEHITAPRNPHEAPAGPAVDHGPARRPERVPIAGTRVLLAPLDPLAHGDSLFRHIAGPDNPHLWTYMHDGPFADRPAFDEYLRRKASSDDPLLFAIVAAEDGAARGIAAYMRHDPGNRVIEVGNIVYGRALQRSAAATEAMYLMAAHAFETLGYRRYEWKCNALNAPSRAAALRLGFTFEGIFRQHMIVKGRNRDTAWFSMLDTEWPDRKARFERWLNPDNFDGAGQQKKALAAMP